MLVDLKHSRTTPMISEEAKVELQERSQTVPAEEAESEIRMTEITEDELDTFTSIFKDKLKLSPYLKDEFDVIASLPPILPETIEAYSLKLPPPKRTKLTNKTIVLDLDDTLVYVITDEKLQEAQINSKVNIERTRYIASKTGKATEINVVIRPYALEMLKQLSAYYEIIVFTAGVKSYGDAIIKVLDPDNILIDHRLYRDNCIKIDNWYIKDLRIINRDLRSMIIVDNKVTSFYNQMENGILVEPFLISKTDSELAGLWFFLRQIISGEDVRVPIASKYSLKLLYQLHKRIKKEH